MRSILTSLALIGLSLTACTRNNTVDSGIEKTDLTKNQKTNPMKNPVSIVEFPTGDFARAMTFYKRILNITIEVVEMEGITIGLFPNADQGTVVQLIYGEGYKASADGTVVYLNGGDDLKDVTDKIEANGGKILIPKTEIGPDMGFYALFIDTEGNKVGLHSIH